MNEQLFEDNVKLITEMDVASGSVIKMLLVTARKNGNNNIELKFKNPKLHSIEYIIVDITDDKKKVVLKIAAILGLKVSSKLLKVNHA